MKSFARIAWGCLLASVWSMASVAGPDIPETHTGFTLQGFGTLGMTRTNDDNAQFVRDLSQPQGAGKSWSGKVDSLFGLQANIHFSPQTEGVLQVVSRPGVWAQSSTCWATPDWSGTQISACVRRQIFTAPWFFPTSMGSMSVPRFQLPAGC
jgi:hypothetical protein